MGRAKIPRKSTSVDMTAMCDVAFLLLSFFILTTKFKPPELLQVTTPKSVSTRPAEDKKSILITMDKTGQVYFALSDDSRDQKQEVIDAIDQQKALGLTAAEKKAFLRSGSFVGVPFSQLKSFLQQPADKIAAVKMPGIPVTDTLNNELVPWLSAAVKAFQGTRMKIFLKGDNDAKYPSFKGVIDALTKVDQLKFQLITDQEGVPEGTDLYRKVHGLKPAS
jgi:biopolymer transport protein ExbD